MFLLEKLTSQVTSSKRKTQGRDGGQVFNKGPSIPPNVWRKKKKNKTLHGVYIIELGNEISEGRARVLCFISCYLKSM